MSPYRTRSIGPLFVVLVLAGLLLMPALAAAQKVDKKAQERLEREKRQHLMAMTQVADSMMAGQAAPSAFKIEWINDFALKAQENKSYVPFTIAIDAAPASSNQLLMYLRVAPKGATAPEQPETGARNGAPVVYPFENLYPIALKERTVSRAFDATGGEYDVYVVVAEPKGSGKDAALGRIGALKQSVTVPDFWTGEIATSPVLLVENIEPLAAPLNQEQQTERPFALGGMEVTPALDQTFSKTEELFPIFFVYNVGTTENGKPDLEVEYDFHQKAEEGEKFFNRTKPQVVNASTLPPQFDVRVGHQVMIAQSVPLSSFPEGDYRLEIKLTDKLSGKSLSKDVPFTVAP
jgi:hypothetical protein